MMMTMELNAPKLGRLRDGPEFGYHLAIVNVRRNLEHTDLLAFRARIYSKISIA